MAPGWNSSLRDWTPTRNGGPTVSVVVPAYNERGNLEGLVREIESSLDSVDFETIIVDDGSTDGTLTLLDGLKDRMPSLLPIGLRRRRGKTRAIQAGFARCQGDAIVLMDADQQYSPEDIPKLLKELERADVVNGARIERQDPNHRLVASSLYNFMINSLFDVRFIDSNSGLKAFRRPVLERIIRTLRPGWHRYLLAISDAMGARVIEIPINHFERTEGSSKFSSPLRLAKGMMDLLSVRSSVNSFRNSRHLRPNEGAGVWDGRAGHLTKVKEVEIAEPAHRISGKG